MGPLQGTHVNADGIREIPILCDPHGRIIATERTGIPGLGVTPVVGSGLTRKVIKTTNAPGSASAIIGWRITIAPDDIVVAGNRLAEHGEDTFLVTPNNPESRVVDVDGDAFAVFVACVANVAHNNAGGTILPAGTSEANTRTAMTKLDFPVGTQVVHFTVAESYQLPPTGSPLLQSMLTVEGFEDA